MKSLPGSPGRWLPNTPAANFRGFSKTGKPYKGFGQRECRSQVQWKVHAHSGSCRKSCLWGRSSPRQLGESVWRGFWKQLPRQASNNWHHPDLYSGKVPTLKDSLTVQLRRLVGKKNHRRGVKVFGKDSLTILQTAQSICFTKKNHCRTQVSQDLRRELVQATWSRDS